MPSAKPSATALALAAWGSPLPDWVEALAGEADRTSQSAAARRLSYSPTVVSCTLRATYQGSLRAVEQRVRDVLMRAQVVCPVLGGIPSARCIAEQAAPFAPTNHERVRLYRACRAGCPNSRIGGDR